MKKLELRKMINEVIIEESNKYVNVYVSELDTAFDNFLDLLASNTNIPDKKFESVSLAARKHLDAIISLLQKNIK